MTLRVAVALALLAAGVASVGCAGPGAGPARGQRSSAPREAVRPPAPIPSRIVPLAPPSQDPARSVGPEVLEPVAAGADADPVVAVVGDTEIRAGQVFVRQLQSDPQRARLWIDQMRMDAVVAAMARRYDIGVTPAAVTAAVDEEVALLEAQLERESGGDLDLATYLERQTGLTVDEYRASLWQDLARIRFRGLVIRYVAALEERAEVRFIVHADRDVLVDARSRVEAGADFGQIARRLSEDETRRDGGRLGPFTRAFRHPIAAQAFELQPGETSPVFPIEDGQRHALVYCLARLPADPRPFAERAAEITADLDARPITPFEQTAFTLRYCRSTEDASPGGDAR